MISRAAPDLILCRVQGTLFPIFFRLCTVFSGILLALSVYGRQQAPTQQQLVLGVALACSLANMLAIGPNVTKIMWDRAALLKAATVDQEAVARVQKREHRLAFLLGSHFLVFCASAFNYHLSAVSCRVRQDSRRFGLAEPCGADR